jgi:hypothetical protein
MDSENASAHGAAEVIVIRQEGGLIGRRGLPLVSGDAENNPERGGRKPRDAAAQAGESDQAQQA